MSPIVKGWFLHKASRGNTDASVAETVLRHAEYGPASEESESQIWLGNGLGDYRVLGGRRLCTVPMRTELKRLSEGDYFGETALVDRKAARTAWVRAERYCVLESLATGVINGIIKEDFPQAWLEIMFSMARYGGAGMDITRELAAAIREAEGIDKQGLSTQNSRVGTKEK